MTDYAKLAQQRINRIQRTSSNQNVVMDAAQLRLDVHAMAEMKANAEKRVRELEEQLRWAEDSRAIMSQRNAWNVRRRDDVVKQRNALRDAVVNTVPSKWIGASIKDAVQRIDLDIAQNGRDDYE